MAAPQVQTRRARPYILDRGPALTEALQPPMPAKGPYPPQTWSLGGTPEVSVDVPVTAVFLVLYVCGAATHMAIFQLNKRRGKKFLFSAMLFGTRPSPSPRARHTTDHH